MVKLFGTSGIRGSVRDKLTEKLASSVGLALATSLGGTGSAVVGSDYRTTSDVLKSSLISGLLVGGTNAIDAGFTPTPCLAYAITALRAEAGVIVTGSHNPPTDNGIKCYSAEGREYTPEEEETLERIIFQESYRYASWDTVGRVTQAPTTTELYTERVLNSIERLERKIRVVVDCANGTASSVTPLLLSRLGCHVISLNGHPDGHFPGRPPEPTPENLKDTARFVVATRADVGIAHDGDADRLAVIDEKGRYVNNDTLLAFFARLLIEKYGSGRVVTSVDTSRRIDRVVEAIGGRVERTRLGKTHVALKLVGVSDVRLCCEPWKIIDPRWGYWGDAVYAACQLLKALDSSQGTASTLFKAIPDYPQQRFSLPCPNEAKRKAMSKIEEALSRERSVEDIWRYDGYRLNFEDGSWILVRPSGTEEKIRIYCEADSPRRLKRLIERSTSIVKKAVAESI